MSTEIHNEIPEKMRKGPLTMMARNSVAANLIMLVFIVGGLLLYPALRKELMPITEASTIQVSARYPGSTPEEVEEGIVIAIEEAVRGIDGVKTVTSTSSEGSGSVILEVLDGADLSKVRTEVERQVQRITSFPADMERPLIREMTRRQRVLSVLVSGDVNKYALREVAEQLRDELLSLPELSVVELSNAENPEISIEVSQEALQANDLKISDIASAVKASSIDLSAGRLKAESGEVLLRTVQRRRVASEYENVVIRANSDGTLLLLGDIAKITDDFEESDSSASYNGRPAIGLEVYAVGDETPIGVSDATRAYIEAYAEVFPEEISIDVRSDRAESYRVRIDLLLSNAFAGLALVLIFLGILLDIRLAFWSAMNMVVSFVGAICFMVYFNLSFNMISLFGFILALGIVVDNSIVIGESIYYYRQRGFESIKASIMGVHGVATPIIFSVLTTIVAFVPLIYMPGTLGKMYKELPIIVIIILCISVFESMLVLPAHLAGLAQNPQGFLKWIRLVQRRIAASFEYFIDKYYRRSLELAMRWRYVVIAISIGSLFAIVGYASSGRMRYTMMPEVEGDTVRATIRMAEGGPVEKMEEVQRYILSKTSEVIDEYGAENVRGVFSRIQNGSSSTIQVYLVPATERKFVSSEFSASWRKAVGEIAGVEAMSFRFNAGPSSGGAGMVFELTHRNAETLNLAAEAFAERLQKYDGVKDVDVDSSMGKQQISYRLRPEARSLGINESDFARQLRSAVYGAEALRQQRGRNELKVFVRFPLADRVSEALVDNFLLRTPSGGELPLNQAASVVRDRAHKNIQRKDGRRVLMVNAEIDGDVTSIESVSARFAKQDMPSLAVEFPGLSYRLGGMQADSQEINDKMSLFFLFSIFIMFGMMAVAFRSYTQPLMIMVAIPFGFVGALLGHIIFGYNLSLISFLGMIALSGVVVNASIILVTIINELKEETANLREAIIEGSIRRFRPIFLSTLTTFLGVFPMILESSKEARFLIPMAISLGFGVLFSALITLYIIPANYMVSEDIRNIFRTKKHRIDQ
ncbi:MAG: efflux RND transporter permease subunit [Bradymonadales bacterium]|jgi:multidrug efflux pump subunit AcrB